VESTIQLQMAQVEQPTLRSELVHCSMARCDYKLQLELVQISTPSASIPN